MTATITSSVAGASTVQKPLPEHVYKPIWHVVRDFFKDKPQDVAKAITYASKWTAMVYDHSILHSVVKGTTDIKNFLCAIEIPKKTDELVTSLRTFHQKSFVAGCRDVMEKVTNLYGSVFDGTAFAKSMGVPVCNNTFQTMNLVNAGGLILGKGSLAVAHAEKINALKEVNPNKTSLYLLHLARDTSYVALGVLITLAAGFSVAVAPWVFLATSTSVLVFSVAGYFYDKIADPEKQNYDKDRHIQNLIAQRA